MSFKIGVSITVDFSVNREGNHEAVERMTAKPVIIFRWGSTEERLSPGVTMGRFKARGADVARLSKKKMEESRCFRRAVGYYAGLCQFFERELTQTDFSFRGQKASVLQTIQETFQKQQKEASA